MEITQNKSKCTRFQWKLPGKENTFKNGAFRQWIVLAMLVLYVLRRIPNPGSYPNTKLQNPLFIFPVYLVGYYAATWWLSVIRAGNSWVKRRGPWWNLWPWWEFQKCPLFWLHHNPQHFGTASSAPTEITSNFGWYPDVEKKLPKVVSCIEILLLFWSKEYFSLQFCLL